MKLNYYSDTDSLYIEMTAKESFESREISPGVVLDYDENGSLTGIDIDNASSKLNINELIINHLPSIKHEIIA